MLGKGAAMGSHHSSTLVVRRDFSEMVTSQLTLEEREERL